MKPSNATIPEAHRSWDTVKAAFDAALALERQFDDMYVGPTVVTTERGPERSAQCHAVPRWVWEASERLTDARCDAEEALIFFPAPDLAAALWKIEYARPRWEAMEDWPECWWSAVLADLRRFVADPPYDLAQRAGRASSGGQHFAWHLGRRRRIADRAVVGDRTKDMGGARVGARRHACESPCHGRLCKFARV